MMSLIWRMIWRTMTRLISNLSPISSALRQGFSDRIHHPCYGDHL